MAGAPDDVVAMAADSSKSPSRRQPAEALDVHGDGASLGRRGGFRYTAKAETPHRTLRA